MYASIAFMATQKLTVTAGGYLTMSEAALDPVDMPEPEEGIDHLDYTFTEMDTYSDLDYSLLQGRFGFSYLFRVGLSWEAEAMYYDLTDDAGGYVYGDESGQYFVVRSGLKIDF